jgi:hypothetical protein
MSSAKERGEPYYYGKQCYECSNCGTLIESKWDDDDECSCQKR